MSAGAALALTLPKPGLCFLAWVAPGVLIWLVRRSASTRAAGLLGFLFGFAFFGVALHWIYLTCLFAGVPVPVAVLAWGALAGVLAVNWALFAAAGRALEGRLPALALPWAWALCWTALEHASLRWTPRFGVDLLAYTQWRHPALMQVGALGGPHVLGFIIVVVNASLAGVVAAVASGGRVLWPALASLSFAVGLAVCSASYGLYALADRALFLASAHRGATAVVLQPNIDQYRKWDDRSAAGIRVVFEALLERPVPAQALVLWPESALPGWLDDPENAAWMAERARRAGAPMVVGAVAQVGEKHHNAAVLVTPEGEAAGLYAKRRLVPFGEFVPLRRLFQPVIGILAELGDFDAGPSQQPLFDTPLGLTAVNLCYEAVFPRLALSDAARGARVLLNLTNDGWYKDTWAPVQHFQANAFRAVETRTTVVRSANTGISGVLDPWGLVVASAPVMTAGRLDVALPLEDPFPRGSPYARYGDWFGLSSLLGAAVLAGVVFRRR